MTLPESCLATGFRNVDADSDIGKLAACLQFMETLPSFAAYKARSFEMMGLKPGDIVLDLGCGLGFDVGRLAQTVGPGGKAIGVDNSAKLLESAGKAFPGVEGVEFKLCDVHRLPFDSGSVDAVRIDRTLQHVEDPQRVISEMARVLKPGGRIVCAEPDWFTFVVDSDDPDTTQRVVNRWRSGFRNPDIGRRLLRRVRKEGLRNTWAEGFVLLVEGLEAVDVIYDIRATVALLEEENTRSARRFSSWLNALKGSDKESAVTASVTLFLVCGQKP